MIISKYTFIISLCGEYHILCPQCYASLDYQPRQDNTLRLMHIHVYSGWFKRGFREHFIRMHILRNMFAFIHPYQRLHCYAPSLGYLYNQSLKTKEGSYYNIIPLRYLLKMEAVSFVHFWCITTSQWRSDIRCCLIQIKNSVKYGNAGDSGRGRKTRGVNITGGVLWMVCLFRGEGAHVLAVEDSGPYSVNGEVEGSHHLLCKIHSWGRGGSPQTGVH